jgi:adenylate cyclase
VLDSTSFAVPTEYALPDDVRRAGTWINNGLAMLVLYLLMNVFVGDINRMEHYLHGANNRFVGLVGAMFPRLIAERLLGSGGAFAERHANCSVLFADIVGFTSLSERLSPEALVDMLSEVFTRFDQCVEQFGLTKIKTIGDAYMVAAGVPQPHPEHARVLVQLAQRMLEEIRDFPQINLRIGIASGELVAGVIGKSRQIYDVWGDVVNMASRMESHGLPGRVQVDQSSHDLVGRFFEFERRAGVTIKGKHGTHDVYLLRTQGPAAAAST